MTARARKPARKAAGTGKQQKVRPQEWLDHAAQISRQKAVASPNILSMTELCDAAGLTSKAVWSYVQRTGTTVRGPMAHLMRPAFRVGAATPYWSQQQLDNYFEARTRAEQELAEEVAGLPEVSAAVAEQRQWWSLRRLAEWSGYAVVTMHRFANMEGFPKPVAVVRAKGPRPLKVRKRVEVEKWLRANRSWRPPGER